MRARAALEPPRTRAPRNRTLEVLPGERAALRRRLLPVERLKTGCHLNRTLLGDCFQAFGALPAASVDLLILDPPYNRHKKLGRHVFSRMPVKAYTGWLCRLLENVRALLKPTASVYICGDWRTSTSIWEAASQHFNVRNRITWEREKGRGALTNWKSAAEDIWFCTVSDRFTFNVEAVKLRRRVIAPYRDARGQPKDWLETSEGHFRDTHPSNLWTDITVPFWSMPENTDHPAQKSEKLMAKLLLASSNPGDTVLDPFLGSGTPRWSQRNCPASTAASSSTSTTRCWPRRDCCLQTATVKSRAIGMAYSGSATRRSQRPGNSRIRGRPPRPRFAEAKRSQPGFSVPPGGRKPSRRGRERG